MSCNRLLAACEHRFRLQLVCGRTQLRCRALPRLAGELTCRSRDPHSCHLHQLLLTTKHFAHIRYLRKNLNLSEHCVPSSMPRLMLPTNFECYAPLNFALDSDLYLRTQRWLQTVHMQPILLNGPSQCVFQVFVCDATRTVILPSRRE